MRIVVRTRVSQDYRQVFAGFNRDLFLQLSPPFPPVTLKQFGMREGEEVRLELNFLLRKEVWVSRITETGETEGEIYFIDEGVELPFFLKSWRHHHHILRRTEGAVIVDDIHFSGPNLFLTCLMTPFLYLQFIYRKPIYKKVFG